MPILDWRDGLAVEVVQVGERRRGDRTARAAIADADGVQTRVIELVGFRRVDEVARTDRAEVTPPGDVLARVRELWSGPSALCPRDARKRHDRYAIVVQPWPGADARLGDGGFFWSDCGVDVLPDWARALLPP